MNIEKPRRCDGAERDVLRVFCTGSGGREEPGLPGPSNGPAKHRPIAPLSTTQENDIG
jgi:hypothetical protein